MPIYDAECIKCKDVEEVFIGMDEEPSPCPKCGEVRKKLCGGYFKLVYDNSKDMCGWGAGGYSTSEYHRKDINFNAGPAGLPGK